MIFTHYCFCFYVLIVFVTNDDYWMDTDTLIRTCFDTHGLDWTGDVVYLCPQEARPDVTRQLAASQGSTYSYPEGPNRTHRGRGKGGDRRGIGTFSILYRLLPELGLFGIVRVYNPNSWITIPMTRIVGKITKTFEKSKKTTTVALRAPQLWGAAKGRAPSFVVAATCHQLCIWL